MKQLKFECPECGTEFTLTANQTKAKERIEALKKAGVDVSELFAMQSADGLEFIASKRDGVISILEEDDPIFQAIIIQGTIPNRQLFRRWVMAQMFRIIYITTNTHGAYKPIGVSEVIRNMGYEYQWKMLNNELYAQHKMMQNGDVDNFRDRNRWFNKRVVLDMAKDYIEKLKKRFEKLKLRKCKGVPYKRINGQNIFVDDFDKKVIKPLLFAVHKIQHAENTYELWHSVQEFN
ncbi:ubiquitin carboxyl-hydrolase, partial [Bacteroides thetaiotaomicron]